MAIELRQSTAVTVVLGPFVDDTDFKTAETALSIAQADIRVRKHGGAYAQSNNVAGAAHLEGGDYGVPLDTTDTGTLGPLRVRIAKAGALIVWQDFVVITAQAWDSKYGADTLQVDVREWIGAPPNALASGRVDVAILAAAAFHQDAADKVWASAARTLTSFGTLITDIFNTVLEGSLSFAAMVRIILSSAALKLSGADTDTIRTRDVADTKDRIVATVDEHGNRTAVALDGS